MMNSSSSAEPCSMSTKRPWRSSSGVSRSRSDMPRMPFIGVRISWLMFARKRLLARLAASACSLAARSSAVRASTSDSR